MRNGILRTFWLVAAVLGCCAKIAWAQTVILRGEARPDSVAPNTWFYHTTDQKVFIYRQNEWREPYGVKGDPVTKVYAVNSVVVVQYPNGRYSTYTQHSVPLTNSICEIKSDGNLLWIRTGFTTFIDTRPREQPYGLHDFILSMSMHCTNIGDGELIKGKLYHCVPAYYDVFNGSYTCADIHVWGLLGPDAEWKIPPIFDAPFQFKNGIAEVVYYGQRRKINWEGEWVE